MRVVVYGMGAVGGCVAALLTRSGTEVVGIARGAQLAAMRKSGLRLLAPDLDERVTITCVASPHDITFRPDDAVLLCMKTQHSAAALDDLRNAGVTDQPVFCLQNGVTNEVMALRRFPNVHGATVMMPATFLEPGKVVCFGQPKYGLFDFGRYPTGTDAADHELAALFDAAGMAGFPMPNVMQSKYGKLLINLNNILSAAIGKGQDYGPLPDLLRDEAVAVYTRAGIAWDNKGSEDPRRQALMRPTDVAGQARDGGSTVQSLMRGAGSIETDYLNGEIVRLGRLHDVPTPANAAVTRLAARLVATGAQPGAVSLAEVLAEI